MKLSGWMVDSQEFRKIGLTSTEAIRLIRDGEKGGRGYGIGEEGEYIPIAALPPPE